MDAELMDKLILAGAVQPSGVTESGEMTFSFTEKLREEFPDVYESVNLHMMSLVSKFWGMGFINFYMSEDEPIITLTEKSFNQEEIAKLDEMDRINLEIIKQAIKRQ